MTELREFSSTAEPRRAATDYGDALSGFFRGWFQHGNLVFVNVVGGIALQPADLHRISFAIKHHAGAFAKHSRRANTRAACSENIRAEDRARRAGQTPVGNLFDE